MLEPELEALTGHSGRRSSIRCRSHDRDNAVGGQADTLPVLVDILPAVFGTLPAVFYTLPAVFHTLPAVFGTLPAVFHTLPAAFRSLPATLVAMFAVSGVTRTIVHNQLL